MGPGTAVDVPGRGGGGGDASHVRLFGLIHQRLVLAGAALGIDQRTAAAFDLHDCRMAGMCFSAAMLGSDLLSENLINIICLTGIHHI